MTAPPGAAPSTRAPYQLAPQHYAVCAKSAIHFCTPVSHRSPHVKPADRLVHSVASTECTNRAAEMCQQGLWDAGVQKSMTFMILVHDDCPTADSHLLSGRARVSGALVTCPMEGVTGTMARLGCVPRSSRGGL